MDELESVKRRVKKLLALSKSPNENEAASALRKANVLMAGYKLTAEQFSEYTKAKVKGTKRFIRWRVVLANAVENLYATYHYTDHEGNIVFIGEELDVFMSTEMYKYLVKTIDRMAKQNIRKNAKYKYRQSYRAGIASRLYDRMYELGQQCSWRNPKELKAQKKQIAEFVEKQVAIETSKKKFEKANQTAFSKGNNDANGINLSRQMTGSGILRIEGDI
ncbi:MAG: DUF2786 domain-containing protein [Treponema sp.]|nr:DUF2786 domain-containing protein [Treponema sp.]